MRQTCPGVENMPPAAINIPARTTPRSSDPEMSPSGSPGRDGLSGQPVKEGTLFTVQTLGGRQIRVPIVLKVYTTNFGRYAVVGQNKVICRDCGYINLKNCHIKSSDNSLVKGEDSLNANDMCPPRTPARPLSPSGKNNNQYSFQITPTKSEGQSLTFSVSSRTELEQWMSVLTDPEDMKDSCLKVTVGSPVLRALGQLTPHRVSSPRTMKKQPIMPALEEE